MTVTATAVFLKRLFNQGCTATKPGVSPKTSSSDKPPATAAFTPLRGGPRRCAVCQRLGHIVHVVYIGPRLGPTCVSRCGLEVRR